MARVTALGNLALRWASLVVLLAIWEACARAHLVSEFRLPSFSASLARLWSDLVVLRFADSASAAGLWHDVTVLRLPNDLFFGFAPGSGLSDIGLTLYRAFAGYALAVVGGVVIGILIARVRVMRWFFDPLVSIGLPLPKIVFLPIFVLWFGVFDGSKILMIAFSAVFPVIVATAAAAEGVDRTLLWSAQSLGAGRHALLWEIVLRASLPQIFTGLQVAMPIALIVTIVAEMAMGSPGLGGTIMKSMRFADSPGVFAGIIAIAVVGMALVRGMELLRRALLAWHPEAQAR